MPRNYRKLWYFDINKVWKLIFTTSIISLYEKQLKQNFSLFLAIEHTETLLLFFASFLYLQCSELEGYFIFGYLDRIRNVCLHCLLEHLGNIFMVSLLKLAYQREAHIIPFSDIGEMKLNGHPLKQHLTVPSSIFYSQRISKFKAKLNDNLLDNLS